MKHRQKTRPHDVRPAPRPRTSTASGHADAPQAAAEPDTVAFSASASWRLTLLAAGLIVLAGVAAYHNSFTGAFVYDDVTSIVENPTIRRLWPIGHVLSPPHGGETVSGRPLLNLSLAINYALGGLNVWGYHATNLLIHIAAALLLFGILRRTFLMPALRDRFGNAVTPLALASTLLWTVHPLQTESVTYIAQRAESLTGFFYLLTLYCAIRGAAASKSLIWYAAAVVACLLGMACKEVMVTAPLIVLLYDRTFLAGSFAEAWRRRWGLYLGLAATWGLLAYLVFSTGLIGRQSEMGGPGPWGYARTQPGVILHYLRLSVWPSPLCFDYGWPVASGFWEIFPGAIVVGLFLAATVWGLMGRKAWGFLGAWFLLILAPTSSILPLNQLAFEHRIYLSLAAVAVLAVAGGYALWDRLLPRPADDTCRSMVARWAAPAVVLAAVLLALGYATAIRNSDYRSLLAIWQDTVEKRPANPVAHYNLSDALVKMARTKEAIEHYHRALSLDPDYAEVHNNLGLALAAIGKNDEAIEHFHEALRLQPNLGMAHNNLGVALARAGKTDEAIEHFHQALRLVPDLGMAHNNLGFALAQAGKTDEAIEHFDHALRLYPDFAEAHYNLGNALSAVGRTSAAIEHYTEALRLKPNYADAHYNLGNVLAGRGRTGEAAEQYNQLLRLMPDSIEALNNLAWLLATHEPAEGGDPDRAVRLAQRARELSGQENARCLDTLAAAYAAAGRCADAVITAERAVQLAEAARQTALAKDIQTRLELYRAGRPYRESPH